ncbi:cytochrome c [Thalassovita sp.]|uniref:cytochrome c n=1 Tax=Thalassovita sp. TaxID=1979401 RepID=UPI0029DE6713|nr:cytochrome c [Thalassovita sp.]
MRRAFLLSGAFILAACQPDWMPEPVEGQRLFADNCAVCHGMDGRGGGDLAADLDTAPADLTLISRRAGGVFPTAGVLSQIDGYTRMKGRDQVMPEYGALLRGDTVPVQLAEDEFSPVPRPLAALVTYLESIQR